jgi:hypothetical protein
MSIASLGKRNAEYEDKVNNNDTSYPEDLHSDIHFAPTCLANPADVYHSDVHEYDETDEFIQGSVEMVWRPGSTRKWRFKVLSQPDAFATEVTLTGACIDGLGLVDLRINDFIQISLRKATISRKGGLGAKKMLALQYSAGVRIRWVTCYRRSGDGKIVDFWPGIVFSLLLAQISH